MSLTVPPANSTNRNNSAYILSPATPFLVSPNTSRIDPATERLLTKRGTLSPQPRNVRQAQGGAPVQYGHQKYSYVPPAPRITEPSRLSETSTADLGQRLVEEQATAIHEFQALNGPQILALRRANLADVYFLLALQNNGGGPFAGRQAFDDRVLGAYAASALSSEGPSISTLLSQFHGLHGAIQASVADFRRAYPGASEEFLRPALWQIWRPAWQAFAAGTQGGPAAVTPSQIHEAAQSAQQARKILHNYVSFGSRNLAGVGDAYDQNRQNCISGGVLNWQNEQEMQVNAPRGTLYDTIHRPWYFPLASWPLTRVNYQNNTAGLPSLVTEQRLNDRPVFVTETGYTDNVGRYLKVWPPVTGAVANAQVTGANALIRYEGGLRRGRVRC
jgi:hypothetical protein